MEFSDDEFDPEAVDVRLRARGAFAEYDEDGQVRRLTLYGDVYDNSSIEMLSTIDGLDELDVRETRITRLGVRRLRRRMPDTEIVGR
jgi:hypothetical protein